MIALLLEFLQKYIGDKILMKKIFKHIDVLVDRYPELKNQKDNPLSKRRLNVFVCFHDI